MAPNFRNRKLLRSVQQKGRRAPGCPQGRAERRGRMNPDQSERKIDDAPFAWLAKSALWRIRDAFDESTFLDQSLAVYLILAELASDAQSATFTASRRRIAERSGASVRRVAEILARFKALNLLAWKQNHLVGTKELAPSTYTLTSCTRSTTLGTPSTRLGRERKTENCTVVEESPIKNLSEESPKGESRTPRLLNLEPWKLDKDKERLEKQIRAEREKSNPDQYILAAWRAELKTLNDELRRRGKSARPVTATDDAQPARRPGSGPDRNAGTYNARHSIEGLKLAMERRNAQSLELGPGPDWNPAADKPTRTGTHKATLTDEQRDACVAKLRLFKEAM